MKSSFRFGMLSTLSLILLLAFGNMTPSVAGATPTYRSFLGRAGASTVVVAAASVGLPSLLSENAEGQIAQPAGSDRSFQIRFSAAARERSVRTSLFREVI